MIPDVKIAYDKIRDTISSCKTFYHITNTRNFINNFEKMYPLEISRYFELTWCYDRKFNEIMK